MNLTQLMGPPQKGPWKGPWMELYGKGMRVSIRIDDADDAEVVRLALEMAERRRYGRVSQSNNSIGVRSGHWLTCIT